MKKNKLGREHPLSYTTEEWIFAAGVCSERGEGQKRVFHTWP